MCLAVPGEIISINNSIPELRMAKVSIGGTVMDATIEWLDEEVNIGDYVLVHAGMALSKIDKQAAAETLEIFSEIVELLDEEDEFAA
jgi:hydrogenase expression/formation protein HypC